MSDSVVSAAVAEAFKLAVQRLCVVSVRLRDRDHTRLYLGNRLNDALREHDEKVACALARTIQVMNGSIKEKHGVQGDSDGVRYLEAKQLRRKRTQTHHHQTAGSSAWVQTTTV